VRFHASAFSGTRAVNRAKSQATSAFGLSLDTASPQPESAMKAFESSSGGSSR
jgi:hypothetical protein